MDLNLILILLAVLLTFGVILVSMRRPGWNFSGNNLKVNVAN